MTREVYASVPFSEVRMTGPFWRERLDTVLARTIPSQHAKLAEVGILVTLREASAYLRSGGAMALVAEAKRAVATEGAPLYSSAPPRNADATLTALPYFLWANREPGSMQVWIAEAAD